MTHSIVTRAQSLVLTVAVLATLVLTATRLVVAPIDPGACRGMPTASASASALTEPASFSPTDNCASGTSPVGYRMP